MNGRITKIMVMLSLILSIFSAFAEEGDRPALSKDIKILFTSDVHCAIDRGWGYGGIWAVRAAFSRNSHVLLVDDGDAIQGEPVGLLTKGGAIIDIMNATGYDIAIPGNHEFDYGLDRFLELAGQADFPYISCNFNKGGELIFPPWVIREFDGTRIAFVGVTTPLTIRESTPKHFMDDVGNYIYGFCQDETGEGVYQAVQRAVDSARAEGADYVVVMAHMGNESEVTPWKYSDVIANTTGIDAWLDGHSHDMERVVMKNRAGRNVIRAACGTKNGFIGMLTISKYGGMRADLLPWIADISAPKLLNLSNPATEAVAAVKGALDEELQTVLATATADLVIYDPVARMDDDRPLRIVQNAETNLGDLCADAYLSHFDGADIALVNASGLRANLDQGDISCYDVLRTLPFGTKLDLIEVTGQQVLDALEWSVHAIPGEFGGFEHVAGLTYTVDAHIPSPCVQDEAGLFVRVDAEKPRRVGDVQIGGEPLSPEGKYKLVTNDFILLDGNGFTMFRNAPLLESGEEDSRALLDYITGPLGGVIGEAYADPYGQGRMTAIEYE